MYGNLYYYYIIESSQKDSPHVWASGVHTIVLAEHAYPVHSDAWLESKSAPNALGPHWDDCIGVDWDVASNPHSWSVLHHPADSAVTTAAKYTNRTVH